MATVQIACSVPSGLVIGVGPFNDPITLAGPNSLGPAFGPNTAYAVTEVDATAWTNWSTTYANNPLVTAGAVFQVD